MVPGLDPEAYDAKDWSLDDIQSLLGGHILDVIPIPRTDYRVYVGAEEVKRVVVLAHQAGRIRSIDMVDIFAICVRLVLEELGLLGDSRPLARALAS